MIGRLFERGVVLRIGAREIRADSSRELHEVLSAMSAVTPARLADLGAMGDRALARRATELDDLCTRVAAALAPRHTEPPDLMASLQIADFPLERRWADVLASAREWRTARGAFQRAALDALLDHLEAERDCVRTLLANRAHTPDRAAAGEPEVAPRQRLVFDAAALAGDAQNGLEFNRIAKGDPLEIAMSAGQAVQVLFAQYRFLVVAGLPWLLVDACGEDCKLTLVRNVVGRSAECDAMVHDTYRAISRRHAVLETEGTRLLRLTDLSSLGTFVPRRYLDNRLH